MTVQAIAAARSRVVVTANPDIHTLNIGITPTIGGGTTPFRSRTSDSTTFDFDTAGLLRNIEVQISSRTTTRCSIRPLHAADGYYVIAMTDDEWPVWDERLLYDEENRIAYLTFSGELLPASIHLMSDELGVGITKTGVLSSVWLFDVSLAEFL